MSLNGDWMRAAAAELRAANRPVPSNINGMLVAVARLREEREAEAAAPEPVPVPVPVPVPEPAPGLIARAWAAVRARFA